MFDLKKLSFIYIECTVLYYWHDVNVNYTKFFLPKTFFFPFLAFFHQDSLQAGPLDDLSHTYIEIKVVDKNDIIPLRNFSCYIYTVTTYSYCDYFMKHRKVYLL